MELSGYGEIFLEKLKLLDILLTLPVAIATVECSFSQKKIVKTHLRNRNLARLMRIVIEGPELTSVTFNEILDVYKVQNRHTCIAL